MIPNPGGVTDIPQGLDEELSRKLNIGQVESDDSQGRRNKDSRSLGQIFGGSFGNQVFLCVCEMSWTFYSISILIN